MKIVETKNVLLPSQFLVANSAIVDRRSQSLCGVPAFTESNKARCFFQGHWLCPLRSGDFSSIARRCLPKGADGHPDFFKNGGRHLFVAFWGKTRAIVSWHAWRNEHTTLHDGHNDWDSPAEFGRSFDCSAGSWVSSWVCLKSECEWTRTDDRSKRSVDIRSFSFQIIVEKLSPWFEGPDKR
jgi:hypothetical protein